MPVLRKNFHHHHPRFLTVIGLIRPTAPPTHTTKLLYYHFLKNQTKNVNEFIYIEHLKLCLQIDEKEYVGRWDLTKEGLTIPFALSVVLWIIFYTAFHCPMVYTPLLLSVQSKGPS